MPQPYLSPPSEKRSAQAPPSPPQRGLSGIFTADPSSEPGKPGASSPDSPSFEATEPFPGELFRVPVPDKIFGRMPEMSDSALRALLALLRLSFRFEPEKSGWVKPDRNFSRAEVEAESGLSGQGARNGLSELETSGHVSIDRSGRSYEYALEMPPPERRYTYLPTDLLEEASSLSGTELRALLTVFRATWGWTTEVESDSCTSRATSSESSTESSTVEHRRWARLSIEDLSRRTGRSESAVKTAVKVLEGALLERLRPTGEAYYYRVIPEALMPELEEEKPASPKVNRKREVFFSMGLSNDLAPDRQRSGPPIKDIESPPERKTQHSAKSEGESRNQRSDIRTNRGSAVRDPKFSPAEEPDSQTLSGFSEQKRVLGQKLANVGVWPRRIPELLQRFSTGRIEASFQLYRERASEMEISRPGAWLYSAITKGFALPTSGQTGTEEETHKDPDRGTPSPGEKVSEARKRALIRRGEAREEDFERFKCFEDPKRKQHFFRLEEAK